jgi:hypothetical protein
VDPASAAFTFKSTARSQEGCRLIASSFAHEWTDLVPNRKGVRDEAADECEGVGICRRSTVHAERRTLL